MTAFHWKLFSTMKSKGYCKKKKKMKDLMFRNKNDRKNE